MVLGEDDWRGMEERMVLEEEMRGEDYYFLSNKYLNHRIISIIASLMKGVVYSTDFLTAEIFCLYFGS